MKPILYEHNETNFTSNGIGRLSPSRCIVTEERNGQFELEMDISVEDKHYADIQEYRILYAPHDETKVRQPFEIYNISRPMGGVVTVNAHHISYRTAKITVMPCSAESAPAALLALKNNSVGDHPFVFNTDLHTEASFRIDKPETLRSRLAGVKGSILDLYGGEYEWDKFTIYLRSSRGSNTDVILRYGKNITSLKKTTDASNIWTGIVPYWYGTSNESGTDDLVTLPEKYVLTDDNNSSMLIPLDMSSYFSQKPTVEELREEAKKYVKDNAPSAIPTSIDVSFVQLWQTQEYASVAPMERLRLCDTLTIKHEKLGVSNKAMVVKTVYDVLLERYESMTVGTVLPSMGDTIRDLTGDIRRSITPKTAMQAMIEAMANLMQGGLGGHMVVNTDNNGKPNELLFMDTEDKATAVKVLRINMNGIAFSKNGYNGPFHTGWGIDGIFYADWITAGTLTANLIKAGILAPIVGKSFLNMLTGEFKFGDDDEYISFQKNDLDDWFLEICTQNLSIGGSPAASKSDVTSALSEYDPADGLNQQKVLNLLSNNGAAKGMWLAGGQLYFSFSYARGGALQLGGTTSTTGYDGVLEVYSANGSKIATIDKTGANFNEALGDIYHTYQLQINGGRLRLYVTGGDDGKQKTIGEIIPNGVYDSQTWTYYMRFSTPQKGFLFCKRSGTSESNYTYTDIFKILTDGIYFLVPVNGGMTVNGGLTVNNGQTVNGELTTNGGITNNGGMIWSKTQIYTQDYVYGTAFVPTSDRRLKKNIKPCDSDIIMNLNVVSFDWKKDGEHVSAGMIAQEVEKICPDLVRENPEGYKGVDYAGIVPHLVKKVQEQQKEIENLKNAFNQMKEAVGI